MKKIINGRKYNTETAKAVGSMERGTCGDFSYTYEVLYKKKTGEFFLYGEGGPMSKYAESVGQNCWGWGEAITPLTEAEAMDWAEQHMDGDEYEEVFGEVEE